MKISALWITKNEEANIARTIESVRAVCDEMVVVDTGSTDATVEIAKKLGARVEAFEWINDFAAARNFALGQVDSDIIIFLDADEWYQPSLRATDRIRLEHIFMDSEISDIGVRFANIDPILGTVITESHAHRIIRGNALKFEGAVHEHLVALPGCTRRQVSVDDWQIYHSGYAKDIQAGKGARNTEMLRKAVESRAEDFENARCRIYLVREQVSFGRARDAVQDVVWLLNHPRLLLDVMRDFVYLGQEVALPTYKLLQMHREKFSRNQVMNVLVVGVEKVYADHPFGKIIRLMHDSILDNREDALLNDLEPSLALAERLRNGETAGMHVYLNTASQLYVIAGNAALRRGNRQLALEYATKAMQQLEDYVPDGAILLLVRCVAGLPFADVVQFMNSIIDTSKRGIQEVLLASLQYEGCHDLYTYYVKQALDAGWAKKTDFWFLMIVLGKYEEAAKAAFQAKTEENAKDVQAILYLAIACGGDCNLLNLYRGELGRFENLLAHYYDGKTDQNVDWGVIVGYYKAIAFAGGRQQANNLANAAPDSVKRQIFAVQTQYYMAIGLYAELLEERQFNPPENDAEAQAILAECEMMTGRDDLALQRIESALEYAQADDNLFNLLSAIAVRAQDKNVRDTANTLYDTYHSQYEEMVDWTDLVNTGYLPGEELRKDRKALATMTKAQFEARIKPADRPPMYGQLAIARKAAMVYLERQFYGEALNCLCRVLQYEPDNTDAYAMLEQVFEKLGNAPLKALAAQRAKQ